MDSDTNSNSLRISRTVSQGRVKVRSTGHEAEVKSKNGVSVSSSMEVGDSCQKKGGEYQDEIHDECPENQPSQTRRICEPALEGDDDFDKLLGSGSEKDLVGAKQRAKGKTGPGRRSGDGDCFEEAGNDLRQVNPIAR